VKALGALLLTAGFLAGAYFAVAIVEEVNWVHYGISAAVMVVGMVLLRVARAAALDEAGEQHTADIAALQSSLANLTAKVRAFEAADGDEEQLSAHHRIDAELLEDINAFVAARESMIPRLGMQNYADIMSPFANAERLLNRAWSASADGYVDEVRSCVRGARSELEKAGELLRTATA